MARTCIVFGLLLCGMTISAMVGTPLKNPSQFIPMMLGIPILFCGVIGLNPHRRTRALQCAAGIALLGLIMGLGGVTATIMRWNEGEEVNLYACRLVSAMAIVCLVFFAVCVVSLLRTRRRKVSVG